MVSPPLLHKFANGLKMVKILILRSAAVQNIYSFISFSFDNGISFDSRILNGIPMNRIFGTKCLWKIISNRWFCLKTLLEYWKNEINGGNQQLSKHFNIKMNTYWNWYNNVSVSIVRDAKNPSRPFLNIMQGTSHIWFCLGFPPAFVIFCRHHIFVRFFSALHLYFCIWIEFGAVWCGTLELVQCLSRLPFYFSYFISWFVRHHFAYPFLFASHVGHSLSLFVSGERWTRSFYSIVVECWDAWQNFIFYFCCLNMWPNCQMRANRSKLCHIASDCFLHFFLFFFLSIGVVFSALCHSLHFHLLVNSQIRLRTCHLNAQAIWVPINMAMVKNNAHHRIAMSARAFCACMCVCVFHVPWIRFVFGYFRRRNVFLFSFCVSHCLWIFYFIL